MNKIVENEELNETKSVKDLSTSQVIDNELEVSKEDKVEAVKVFTEIDLSIISDKTEEGENQASIKNERVNEKLLSFDYCSYKCKRESDLQKHVKDKHVISNKGHQCIQCREKFLSLIDILEHDHKKHKDNKVHNDTSFVLVGACWMNLIYEDPRRGWLPLMS